MSGPKVVHIVTREEILEICQGHLARVDAALAEWTRIGRRNNCIDEGALAAAVRRRDALAALIAADRLSDLQNQAPAEVAFLQEDMQKRLAKVAAEQAAARSRARREREAATSLLRALRSRGQPLDPVLEATLERGDPEALATGFQLLSKKAVMPTASTDLAAKLREDGTFLSFASWLSRQPVSPADPATDRIEVRIDELAQLVDANSILKWRARLEEAAGASPARRGLLLDGLEIETGRALTEARRRSALLSDLRLMLAELTAAGMQAEGYGKGLEILQPVEIGTRLEEVRAALEAHRAGRAAAARRAAVLEGLASLGYEVAEGMSTTFAQDGRLVLRNASRPDYGVEVSAAAGGKRMQMRAVAFETGGRGPDITRDRDAETIWCGDVSNLQERLAATGSDLSIEKALPIGATPLKRLAIAGAEWTSSAEAPAPRERTLR
jgi:hypothetical protein